MAQEKLIKASGIPYTIVRSTQFFEFMGGIAQVRDRRADGSPVTRSAAAHRVGRRGRRLADVALGAPVNGTIEIAGPERVPLDELVRRFLRAKQDPRQVVADTHARYFGAELDDRSLTPGDKRAHRRDPLRRLAQPSMAQR